MFRSIAVTSAVLAVSLIGIAGCKKERPQQTESPQTAPAPAASAPAATDQTGEQLFKQRCAACHPDGGNIITPQKTLHAAVLADHNITKPEDIVKLMRNPGPGMRKFDEETIPDKEAKIIAEYVLATFR